MDKRKQEDLIIELQQDACLLLTGNPSNEKHRRNIQKMHE